MWQTPGFHKINIFYFSNNQLPEHRQNQGARRYQIEEVFSHLRDWYAPFSFNNCKLYFCSKTRNKYIQTVFSASVCILLQFALNLKRSNHLQLIILLHLILYTLSIGERLNWAFNKVERFRNKLVCSCHRK